MKDFWSKYGIQQQQIDNLYILTVDQQWVATPKQMPELQQTIEFHQPEPRETYQMTSLDRRPLPVFLSLKNPRIQAEPQQMNAVNIQPDKYQVTFMPGLSSAGPRPQTTAYHVSFNMLWGQTGLVDGLEVGGLINEVTWDVKGFQMAGLINQVGETMEGVQVSGGINVTYGAVWGAQMASIANVTGEMHGFQVAGLVNIANGSVHGVQCAGGANIANGPSSEYQLAGMFNLSRGASRSQFSGLFNRSGNVDGWQLASFGNRADTVYGSQVGLINIADSVSGASIGLLNFVTHGHNRMSLGTSATFPVEFIGSLGSRKLHNLFQMGWQQTAGNDFWSLGYGLGTFLPLKSWGGINLDALAHWIIAGNQANDNGVLYTVKADLEIALTPKVALYGGPSWRIYGHRDPDLPAEGQEEFKPWTGNIHTVNRTGWNVYHWTGWSAGIRYGLK
ncbi:MAG: hypothetical protein R2806_16420 [Saprospiraceae bacterium]